MSKSALKTIIFGLIAGFLLSTGAPLLAMTIYWFNTHDTAALISDHYDKEDENSPPTRLNWPLAAISALAAFMFGWPLVRRMVIALYRESVTDGVDASKSMTVDEGENEEMSLGDQSPQDAILVESNKKTAKVQIRSKSRIVVK